MKLKSLRFLRRFSKWTASNSDMFAHRPHGVRHPPTMLVLLVVMSPFAVVCGARTGLDVNAADGEGDAGSADVGQLDALDDSEAGGAAPCSSWAGTHAPVQISQPTGNMALQATLVESSCATVGYANNN